MWLQKAEYIEINDAALGRSPKTGSSRKVHAISAGRANSISELRYIEQIASDMFSKEISQESDQSSEA